jgi:DNA repair protein RadC
MCPADRTATSTLAFTAGRMIQARLNSRLQEAGTMRRKAYNFTREEFRGEKVQEEAVAPKLGRVPVYRVELVKDRTRKLKTSVRTPDDAADIFSEYLANVDREHMVVLLLNTKGKVLGLHVASIGDLNSAIVSPREIFKVAILANAASIIVGHNHPSGDPEPSPEDYVITERLRQSGEILDIRVDDHIVVGEAKRFVSLMTDRFRLPRTAFNKGSNPPGNPSPET